MNQSELQNVSSQDCLFVCKRSHELLYGLCYRRLNQVFSRLKSLGYCKRLNFSYKAKLTSVQVRELRQSYLSKWFHKL